MKKRIDELKEKVLKAIESEDIRLSYIKEIGNLAEREQYALDALLEVAKKSHFDKEKREAVSLIIKIIRQNLSIAKEQIKVEGKKSQKS